jgi:hypothetical protein
MSVQLLRLQSHSNDARSFQGTPLLDAWYKQLVYALCRFRLMVARKLRGMQA